MLIAHLRFSVAPDDRSYALEVFTQGAQSVRAMKGCVAFYPYYDPDDCGTLGVIQEWEREEDFAAYLSSHAFNAFELILRPMMAGAPVSRRFRAELIETIC